MAYSLRESGLDAKIKQDGWLSSRIIQIAFYALSYLSNPNDKHAALYMMVTELGDVSLQNALNMYLKDKKFSHPLLELLDSLRDDVTTLTLSRQLIAVIEAFDLWTYIIEHEDASQQRANLLKLIELCSEFEALQFESLNALGVYGRNLNSFLTWLSMNEDDAQPPAKSIDTQAVQLLTWHSSKGLEWPVVVVLGIDEDKAPRLPNISLGYTDDARENPLENTYVKFFTEFADKGSNQEFIKNLETSTHSTTENLLYVAMTRAREQLILPWASFKEEKVGEFSFMNKLLTKCEMKINKDGMKMKGLDAEKFNVSIIPATINTNNHKSVHHKTISYGRVAIKKLNSIEKIPLQIAPSSLEEKLSTGSLEISIKKYGSQVNLSKMKMAATDLGTLLHHSYHALLADKKMKERLFNALETKLSTEVLNQVVTQVDEFEKYAKEHLAIENIQCEVPILGNTTEGSIVSGSIDLLLETKDGYWIIDHKSDQVEDEGFTAQFIHHYPQLMAYVKYTKLDKPILGVGINWIRYGMISLKDIPNG